MKIKKILIIILIISIMIFSTQTYQGDELLTQLNKNDNRCNPEFLNNNGEVNLGLIIINWKK